MRSVVVWRTCATALLLAGAASGSARADVITSWHEVATNTIAAAPAAERPSAGIHWAMVHGAMYDAVNAIVQTHEPLALHLKAPTRGASVEAAAAEAAYGVLKELFPSQLAALDAARTSSLADIPAGHALKRGLQIGAASAAAMLELRHDDGRLVDVPFSSGTDPGEYQLANGGFGALPPGPVTPWVAQVRPFVLRAPSQFRPDGPPRLTSSQYASDFNEVKLIGEGASSVRHADQTEIALFHTMNPTLFWGRNLKSFVEAQGLDTTENARLMAQVFLAYADANIACWNAKYHFLAWRPVTAIENAELDGNAATTAQPGWRPPVATPPHPEYPAAHGCVAGAVMESLRQFFETRYIDFEFASSVPGTVVHHYAHINEFLDEIADARVFGGMHFRFSVEDGEELGRKVGRYVAREALQPLPGCDRWNLHRHCPRHR